MFPQLLIPAQHPLRPPGVGAVSAWLGRADTLSAAQECSCHTHTVLLAGQGRAGDSLGQGGGHGTFTQLCGSVNKVVPVPREHTCGKVGAFSIFNTP